MGGAFPLAANRIVEHKLRQLSALDSVPLGPQWWVIACKKRPPGFHAPRGRAVCLDDGGYFISARLGSRPSLVPA
jgi:hypothetical protein